MAVASFHPDKTTKSTTVVHLNRTSRTSRMGDFMNQTSWNKRVGWRQIVHSKVIWRALPLCVAHENFAPVSGLYRLTRRML